MTDLMHLFLVPPFLAMDLALYFVLVGLNMLWPSAICLVTRKPFSSARYHLLAFSAAVSPLPIIVFEYFISGKALRHPETLLQPMFIPMLSLVVSFVIIPGLRESLVPHCVTFFGVPRDRLVEAMCSVLDTSDIHFARNPSGAHLHELGVDLVVHRRFVVSIQLRPGGHGKLLADIARQMGSQLQADSSSPRLSASVYWMAGVGLALLGVSIYSVSISLAKLAIG